MLATNEAAGMKKNIIGLSLYSKLVLKWHSRGLLVLNGERRCSQSKWNEMSECDSMPAVKCTSLYKAWVKGEGSETTSPSGIS